MGSFGDVPGSIDPSRPPTNTWTRLWSPTGGDFEYQPSRVLRNVFKVRLSFHVEASYVAFLSAFFSEVFVGNLVYPASPPKSRLRAIGTVPSSLTVCGQG